MSEFEEDDNFQIIFMLAFFLIVAVLSFISIRWGSP